MSSRILLLFICTGIYAAGIGQVKPYGEFEKFAFSTDSLFMKAYEQKDIKRCEDIWMLFLKEFDKLDSNAKRQFHSNYVNGFYNLACTYSLINDKPNALKNLRIAIRAGYDHYTHMLEDADLDNIRHEAAYNDLLQPLRETGDYLYILKKAGSYGESISEKIPAFTYQSADKPELVLLRNKFKLDSVAGKGNEVSRVINLMHWVHTLVPHDGNINNPAIKNALNLIVVCKNEKRGLNCRGLATVLNECYLAMGFKSRFVTCLPKDSLGTDPDCHVINMVFIPSLNKWVWMDPTNDAYVMNEKGELLGIKEVRERLVAEQPLLINPDANWNHRESVNLNNYLYQYMAKNLYMLECPVNSEYNTETVEPGKKIMYIRLVPFNYYVRVADKATGVSPEARKKNICTTNEKIFWNNPEMEN